MLISLSNRNFEPMIDGELIFASRLDVFGRLASQYVVAMDSPFQHSPLVMSSPEDEFVSAGADDTNVRCRGRRCRLCRAVRIWHTAGRFWQGGGMCSQFRWSRVPH